MLGAMAAVIAFVPVWLPAPLMLGDFSLAFLVPAALALWSLLQPARPGAIGRALSGGFGRGLWLEALCVAAIAILAGLTMLYSPEPSRAFRVLLPMGYAPCALILLSRASPARHFRLVCGALYAGALVLAFALLLTQTGAGRSLVMRDYRFLAFFENPNQLGVVFLAVWPLSLALLMTARSAGVRLMHLAIVLILAGAILMSGTKTALALGFISGALIWLYHGSRSGSIGTMVAKLVMILCAIILAGRKNGCVILGGGSPKNFYLQAQPTLWEVYGIPKGGNDYFIQITTDQVVWGGLSGATPAEAVSWGKVNPGVLPDTVVAYCDSTIAFPLFCEYAIGSKNGRRPRKDLVHKRDALVAELKRQATAMRKDKQEVNP